MPKWAQALLALSLGASSFVASDAMQVGAAGETIVEGVVVDADTGLGIGGLDVGLMQVFSPGVPGSAAGGTVTQPDGTFRLFVTDEQTPTGQFQLMVIDSSDTYGSRYFLPVDVVAGATTQARVELVQGGTVAGTITGPDGQPLSDLCVMLTDLDGNRMLRSDDPSNCARPDGSFRTRAIPPGDYTASVRVGFGVSIRSVEGLPVTITGGGSAVLDIEMLPALPTAITGRVVDAVTGDVLSGVGVAALVVNPNGNESGVFTTVTSAAGEFTLDVTGWANSPWPFRLSVTDPTGLHLRRSGIEVFVQSGYTEPVEITMEPGGAIDGSITIEGEPDGRLSDCAVLLDAASAPLDEVCSFEQFRTRSLPSGDYFILVPEQSFLHAEYLAGPFRVEAGAITDVSILVPRARGAVSGVVVDIETGDPIPSASVFVQFPDGSDTGLPGVRTGSDGTFEIDVSSVLVRSDRLQVWAADFTQQRYYRSGVYDVTVRNGAAPPVTIFMQPARTAITGEVRDNATGAPIQGVEVTVDVDGPDGDPVVVATDADGMFTAGVQQLLAFGSEFRVSASDPLGRYEPVPAFGVVVQEGYIEPIGIAMIPASDGQTFTARFAPWSLDPPPSVNRARTGSTVPLAWRVVDDAGKTVRDRTVVDAITVARASCRSWLATGPAARARSRQGLEVSRRGLFRFDWVTPRASGCVLVTITLEDGSELEARVALAPRRRR